jgi:hypothetical protein
VSLCEQIEEKETVMVLAFLSGCCLLELGECYTFIMPGTGEVTLTTATATRRKQKQTAFLFTPIKGALANLDTQPPGRTIPVKGLSQSRNSQDKTREPIPQSPGPYPLLLQSAGLAWLSLQWWPQKEPKITHMDRHGSRL